MVWCRSCVVSFMLMFPIFRVVLVFVYFILVIRSKFRDGDFDLHRLYGVSGP